MSQADLAEALDVSRQAVSKWEVGTALPSTENCAALGRLFSVPTDTFFNPAEQKASPDGEASPVKSSPSKTYQRWLWLLLLPLIAGLLYWAERAHIITTALAALWMVVIIAATGLLVRFIRRICKESGAPAD